ncbi:MAG TPA: hypothetical protein VGB89_07760 [Bacteroidota bacterium]
MHKQLFFLLILSSVSIGMAQKNDLVVDGESHFAAIRQLTFGGQNAEGYFSFDERSLIFQSTRDSFECDQEYIIDLASGNSQLVSTGIGRTTCGYFLPEDKKILYASTHHLLASCPPPPDYSKGYVWAVYPEFDIFLSDRDGSNLTQLTTTPGYDAEATVSPLGDKMVFTSTRNGDLDLFAMNLDGSHIQQLTNEVGYDGGAFYSWDGSKIIYRAGHYTDSSEAKRYMELLATNLVRPTRLELFVMNADGSGKQQVTSNGAANFAPFFHPDNKRVIFASNLADPKGRDFDLYLINIDGTGLERITFNDSFDGFPMFTHDGKKLVFASNRKGKIRGETNLFLADWKE